MIKLYKAVKYRDYNDDQIIPQVYLLEQFGDDAAEENVICGGRAHYRSEMESFIGKLSQSSETHFRNVVLHQGFCNEAGDKHSRQHQAI